MRYGLFERLSSSRDPLSVAVRCGHYHLDDDVQLGVTALHMAAYSGYATTVRALVGKLLGDDTGRGGMTRDAVNTITNVRVFRLDPTPSLSMSSIVHARYCSAVLRRTTNRR